MKRITKIKAAYVFAFILLVCAFVILFVHHQDRQENDIHTTIKLLTTEIISYETRVDTVRNVNTSGYEHGDLIVLDPDNLGGWKIIPKRYILGQIVDLDSTPGDIVFRSNNSIK